MHAGARHQFVGGRIDECPERSSHEMLPDPDLSNYAENRLGHITRQGSPVVRLDLTEAVSQACRLSATRRFSNRPLTGRHNHFGKLFNSREETQTRAHLIERTYIGHSAARTVRAGVHSLAVVARNGRSSSCNDRAGVGSCMVAARDPRCLFLCCLRVTAIPNSRSRDCKKVPYETSDENRSRAFAAWVHAH